MGREGEVSGIKDIEEEKTYRGKEASEQRKRHGHASVRE